MAFFCLNMLEIALVLAPSDPAYEDMAIKFLDHFMLISAAISDAGVCWDEEDGFFYDRLGATGRTDACRCGPGR